ncbi:MAG: DUF1465 family protein [Methyloligellaceae bacterium]
MSSESKTGSSANADNATIPFGQKYTESENFSVVFQQGMALVEETAAYLDGDGREEARKLGSAGSLAYATESMRLTTRLMQLASWLLIRRAVNDGEMTPQQAFEEQNKVRFQHSSSGMKDAAYDALPERLKELNETSIRLHRRVMAIDKLLKAEAEGAPVETNRAIGDQLSRLQEAFGSAAGKAPDEEAPPDDSA